MEIDAQKLIRREIRQSEALIGTFKTPLVALPTVCVAVVSFLGFGLSGYALLAGYLPAFITIPISAMFIFWSFTPLHEAVHGNASRISWLNDAIGSLCAQLMLPGFSTDLYRWLHLTHHARAGQSDDPDMKFIADNWQERLFNSAFLDILWTRFYLANWSSRPQKERRRFSLGLSLYAAVFLLGFSSNYAAEFLLIWVLPMLLGRIIVVYLFGTIQHTQGIEQRDDLIGATRIQDVHESYLQRFFLLGQAQHLIHHMYPHVPWYRYNKIWQIAQTIIPHEKIRWGSYLNKQDRAFTPQTDRVD
jgi:vanillate O-demethylase ferredoxin subunit